MSSSLWSFEERLVALLDELSDLIPDAASEDEATKEKRVALEAELEDLLSRESEKVDRVAAVLRRLERTSEECAEEATRLTLRAKRIENDRGRLVNYVLDVMRTWGSKKLEGKTSTLTRIQNASTIEVDEPATLPFEFQRWTVSFAPKTVEQYERLLALAETFEATSMVVAVDKPKLKKYAEEVERAVVASLAEGVPVPQNLGSLPEGVRLKPGTWRLSVR